MHSSRRRSRRPTAARCRSHSKHSRRCRRRKRQLRRWQSIRSKSRKRSSRMLKHRWSCTSGSWGSCRRRSTIYRAWTDCYNWRTNWGTGWQRRPIWRKRWRNWRDSTRIRGKHLRRCQMRRSFRLRWRYSLMNLESGRRRSRRLRLSKRRTKLLEKSKVRRFIKFKKKIRSSSLSLSNWRSRKESMIKNSLTKIWKGLRKKT